MDLSSQQSLVLEKFFRTMIEDSEGGYVLFGEKPVCIHGYCVEDYFFQRSERHKDSVNLREGALIWKNIKVTNITNQNIIIHIYDQQDIVAVNYIHILFINRKLFLETAQANLPLFQYVLGPNVTPISLLNKLVEPNESFHKVLRNDKVLIGILLGYGTQNSLYVSRIENIGESCFASENPPYRSNKSKFENMPKECENMLLIKSEKKLKKVFPQPSFGYFSLEEEIQSLNHQVDVSSRTLTTQSPPFIFGRLKNDNETSNLIQRLEKTQKYIRNLITSKNFLKDILHIIYPNEGFKISNGLESNLPFDESEQNLLPYLIGANIYKVMQLEDKTYQDAFIQGMKDVDMGNECRIEDVDTIQYARLKSLSQIYDNLQVAETYFNKLDNISGVICVSPLKLYYRIVQEGKGVQLDNDTQVILHYTIKTPDDQILVDTWKGGKPLQVNLADTFLDLYGG